MLRETYFDENGDPIEDESYCDYCEKEGHMFRSCPRRDDHPEEEYSTRETF